MLYRTLNKINKIKKSYQKKNLEIFLFCGPHLHARGPQNFLSRPACYSYQNVLAGCRFTCRGLQFADPCSRAKVAAREAKRNHTDVISSFDVTSKNWGIPLDYEHGSRIRD